MIIIHMIKETRKWEEKEKQRKEIQNLTSRFHELIHQAEFEIM